MQTSKLKHLTILPACFSLTVLLSACGGGGTDYDFSDNPVLETSPAPVFSPADGGPSTNNLLFAGSTDGTLNIPFAPNDPSASILTALNTLDGFSTTNPITTNFSTPLDKTSLAIGESIRVFEVNTVASGGVTGVVRELSPQEMTATTVDAENKTLAIVPLRPLKESTTYMAVLTNGIKDEAGTPVGSSSTYLLLKSEIEIPDTATPDPAQLAQLRGLRPLINSFESAASSASVAKDSIVLSWTFTTQSITPVLDTLAASATSGTLNLVPTGFTPKDVIPTSPGISDIHIGTLEIPYYLEAPTTQNPTAALTSFWKGAGGSFLTRFNPTAVETSKITTPVLLTVPKETATNPKPASGWPIVMYQHGITRVRTDMIIYADNMAQAGFAMIGIDLPLHGALPLRGDGAPNPFYAGNTLIPNDREATFDMDFANNATGAIGTPDGNIDPSGTHFINLGSLLTSRDNVRQGVSNLLVLRRSLQSIPDIDAEKVGFIAHSLGGVIGSTYLGVETKPLPTSLVTTGGGISGIVNGSASFGPFVRTGLAANGVTGDDVTRFFIGAQAVLDSADPLNFAESAAAVHPIHMIEVIGDGSSDHLPDQTFPNLVPPLSGTEPLAALMGLKSVSQTVNDIAPGAGGIVRFIQGDHSSPLDPTRGAPEGTSYLNVFTEMHKQMAVFQRSFGTTIQISDAEIIKQ